MSISPDPFGSVGNPNLGGNSARDLAFTPSGRASDRIESSIPIKMLVGAVVTPVPVGIVALKVMVETYGKDAAINPWIALALLAGSVTAGAFLGAMLDLKDRVERRLHRDQPVAYPLRIFFGYGWWSLMAVWFPLIILTTILMMPLAMLIER